MQECPESVKFAKIYKIFSEKENSLAEELIKNYVKYANWR